uniref:GDSL esterase/lipase n=1 Tax=Triticum urartu TaxID=4572 RepID=A0A8R7P6A6_TRIUA
MASSLFIVGEIGVNDYLVAFAGNTTVREARTFVPHIVGAVRSVVAEVLAAGARTVLIPGMIPLGCDPHLLALYQSGDHDPASGCIKSLNDLAELHNRALNGMLGELRRAHPVTTILYADLYGAVADLIASPRKYGFRDEPLAACCGGSGVQLQHDGVLRRGRDGGVRRPARVRVLGRSALHGGRQQAHGLCHVEDQLACSAQFVDGGGETKDWVRGAPKSLSLTKTATGSRAVPAK